MACACRTLSLQELKDRNNILDVVSGYVNLKRAGEDHVRLMPVHGERPFLSRKRGAGVFPLLRLRRRGNVITFIRKVKIWIT